MEREKKRKDMCNKIKSKARKTDLFNASCGKAKV